jgi:hypothetical protein
LVLDEHAQYQDEPSDQLPVGILFALLFVLHRSALDSSILIASLRFPVISKTPSNPKREFGMFLILIPLESKQPSHVRILEELATALVVFDSPTRFLARLKGNLGQLPAIPEHL